MGDFSQHLTSLDGKNPCGTRACDVVQLPQLTNVAE